MSTPYSGSREEPDQRVLSYSQLWSAYQDMVRKYRDALNQCAKFELEIQELKNKLDKASEFRKDFDAGC